MRGGSSSPHGLAGPGYVVQPRSASVSLSTGQDAKASSTGPVMFAHNPGHTMCSVTHVVVTLLFLLGAIRLSRRWLISLIAVYHVRVFCLKSERGPFRVTSLQVLPGGCMAVQMPESLGVGAVIGVLNEPRPGEGTHLETSRSPPGTRRCQRHW